MTNYLQTIFNDGVLFASFGCGFGVLIFFWIFFCISSGHFNFFSLVVGADGRPSSSKLQWFLWTVLILFSYVVIYAAKLIYASHNIKGAWDSVLVLPENLIWAMGFSTTSMAVAKGITSSNVANGTVVKSPALSGGSFSDLFNDDDGVPDLSKIQMLCWTFIAMVVYMFNFFHSILSLPSFALAVPSATVPPGWPAHFNFPDVDRTLMALMGLGHGGYLGKKLTTSDIPKLTGVTPRVTPDNSSGLTVEGSALGMDMVVEGMSFGNQQGSSFITIDGERVNVKAAKWSDGKVSFHFPSHRSDGSLWKPGQQVMVGLNISGKESVNKIPVSIPTKGVV